MKERASSTAYDRRDFIKTITLSSTAAIFGFGGIFNIAKAASLSPDWQSFDYKYSTCSVDRVMEVKEWFDQLRKERKLSRNKHFKSYTDFDFDPYKVFPGAKSIILLAVPEYIYKTIVNYDGKRYEILQPTGYIDDGISSFMIRKRVMEDIIMDRSKHMEWSGLPLKTFAVRSGLARYGKNNISYVKRYGSNHRLMGFYTNAELEDQWGDLKMLRECRGCTLCIKACPTSCISDQRFVIEVDKCVTLFNEISDGMPQHINPESHNALVGCIKCQEVCPENEKSMKQVKILAELSHEDTAFLLSDSQDPERHKILIEKMPNFSYAKKLDYFRRNFKLVMANHLES